MTILCKLHISEEENVEVALHTVRCKTGSWYYSPRGRVRASVKNPPPPWNGPTVFLCNPDLNLGQRNYILLCTSVWESSSSTKQNRRALGPTQTFGGVTGSFSGLRQLEPDVDHSPPSSAEVKNEWSFTSASLIRFMMRIGTTTFTGADAKLWKATTSFVISLRLCVRMEQLGFLWTDFH